MSAFRPHYDSSAIQTDMFCLSDRNPNELYGNFSPHCQSAQHEKLERTKVVHEVSLTIGHTDN